MDRHTFFQKMCNEGELGEKGNSINQGRSLFRGVTISCLWNFCIFGVWGLGEARGVD